jgi:hypothetical protein
MMSTATTHLMCHVVYRERDDERDTARERSEEGSSAERQVKESCKINRDCANLTQCMLYAVSDNSLLISN